MTRQQVSELLPIIKAFGEGKTIQMRNKELGNEWITLATEDAHVDWLSDAEYRVLPEPREFWIKTYEQYAPEAFYFLEELHEDTKTDFPHKEIIHVKEVL